MFCRYDKDLLRRIMSREPAILEAVKLRGENIVTFVFFRCRMNSLVKFVLLASTGREVRSRLQRGLASAHAQQLKSKVVQVHTLIQAIHDEERSFEWMAERIAASFMSSGSIEF